MSDQIIVVGVDGSEPSKDALRWAADQARLTGAELRVVMAWSIPTAAYWAPLPTGLDMSGDATRALHEEVVEVVGAEPDVPVREIVVEGHPALALLEQSGQADLLVVGSRGHGEFTGMLIGSVSEHCVAHAECPVVVVRKRASAAA